MKKTIDFSKVSPISQMKGDCEEDTKLLNEMLAEAKEYLLGFSWHKGIKEIYFGLGIGGIITIFLFRIEIVKPDVDEWIWVIVGDLPPAYIDTGSNDTGPNNTPNPACALDCYIGAMYGWVKAVKNGESVEDLIPVNVPPTLENAKLLETRLKFLDTEILKYYSDDLKT